MTDQAGQASAESPLTAPVSGEATEAPPGTAAASPVSGEATEAPPGTAVEEGAEEPWPAAMRVVTVASVVMELPAVHPQVVLKEAESPWRELRIPVGFAEGTAIAYALKAVQTPRPLTHSLVVDLLDRHGVEVDALRITGKSGPVYLAQLDTSGPRGRAVVECRPSDGFALILRRALPTPILVAEELLTPSGGG